jgi:hypothetical protein
MISNFTFRDFFVYFFTGVIFIICIGFILINKNLYLLTNDLIKYDFIQKFSFLGTILIIPPIYLLGHIIGSINYNLLKLYIKLHNSKFIKNNPSQLKYFILIKIQQLLYRQRVVYAIIKYTKSDKKEKAFKTVEEFWISCSKLQIENKYTSAEYWYVLNELFNSINLVFFVSTIISFITQNWLLGEIYFFLTIITFNRAKQYAYYFIKSICNLTTANHY